MGHAKVLLGADTPAQQIQVCQIVISKGLSVRDTERLLDRLKTGKEEPEKPDPGSEDIYFSDISENLSRRFGTKVQIKRQGKKGKVEIEFYNDDDLDRLITLLNT